MLYGDFISKTKDFDTGDFVDYKISSKSRAITILNKKHILFLACLLINSSETAKSIVKYLLELEGLANNDLKSDAIELSMSKMCSRGELRDKIEMLKSKLREVEPYIEFSKAVEVSDIDISIDNLLRLRLISLDLEGISYLSF